MEDGFDRKDHPSKLDAVSRQQAEDGYAVRGSYEHFALDDHRCDEFVAITELVAGVAGLSRGRRFGLPLGQVLATRSLPNRHGLCYSQPRTCAPPQSSGWDVL